MGDDCNSTIREAFQEPRKKFWLRSRKRTKSDAISISSMDVSIDSDMRKKKKRRITEVASSIFSTATISAKLGNTLHNSFHVQPHSGDLCGTEDESDTKTIHKKKKSNSQDIGNFMLRSWVLDVANGNIKDNLHGTLTRTEIKRQEAIYELYCGENVLLNDLYTLRDFYLEPLSSANILNPEEMHTLFNNVTSLIEIHSSLRNELADLRDESGLTETIGPTILNWLPSLTQPYIERCKTQVFARYLLAEKKATNKRFQTFLKRKLESPHSIDLWTYVDVPRSRIVKYPLLVKQILKHTPPLHGDKTLLEKASDILAALLSKIDKAMGDAECQIVKSKINAKSEHDPDKCIESAAEFITEGQLKDTRGMKLHCFLFDTCFIVTRQTRRLTRKYNVVYPIIPKDRMVCTYNRGNDEDFGFKIGDYHLLTQDGHGKRHWIESFSKVCKVKANVTREMKDGENKENESHSTLTTRPTRKSTS